MGGFSPWNARQPVSAIVLVSLLAVIVNCYPILFCGRSFVSPACVGPLVYSSWPTLPGLPANGHQTDPQGSDTESMMYWGVPVGFMESRALLDDVEMPLWDRYGRAGSTLIGQGVSMLGDPLQLIVIFGRGSALAWDLKFIMAKFLLCVGLGLLVLRLTGLPGLAMIYAVIGAYSGTNFFIKNHPVFFVFAYAPWILLSAFKLLEVASPRYRLWGLVWLLANFACFNAGHIEVAVDLIGGLNLAALIQALCRGQGTQDRLKVMARMAVGTLLFLGLTAPVWVSFLTAQQGAYSMHMLVQLWQIPLPLLPGIFDDVFYRLLHSPGELFSSPGPGGSLLFLSGCIFSAINWRRLMQEPFFWINSVAILILTAGIYVSWTAPLLEVIPFFNRVGHLGTDFSYLLIVHLAIQSAYGYACLAAETDFRRVIRPLSWLALILEAGGALYCFGFDLSAADSAYILLALAGAVGAPWLFAVLRSRRRQISWLGWTAILSLGFLPLFRFGLYHAGNEAWLMIPGPRAVLNAPSPALEKLKAQSAEPFRVVGLGQNLWGDYAAVYGLEDIRTCAPLGNLAFMVLANYSPGITFSVWRMQVVNPVQAQPLLNLLNVRYVLDRPGVIVPDGIDLRVIDRSDFGLLENPEAWPRAFFDSKIKVFGSVSDFAGYLFSDGRKPFIALAPNEIAAKPELGRLEVTNDLPAIPATHYQLEPNSTAFDIHAPSAGVVCLTEGQAKDFTVRINNEPGRVLTVNCAFKGVYLKQPGDYHVVFTYRPRYWRATCLVFWVSLAVSLVLGAGGIRRRVAGGSLIDKAAFAGSLEV